MNRPIETDWIVITGAPCSGKTTIIDLLHHRKGIRTNPDITRLYIESQNQIGINKNMVRDNYLDFLKITLALKVENAKSLPKNEFIVHDYGIPDHLAFARSKRVNFDDEIRDKLMMFKYRKVLVFEPIKIRDWASKSDSVRSETYTEQVKLDAEIRCVYEELGYSILNVPLLNISARYDLVAEHITSS